MTTITTTAEALEIIENKINQESDRLRSTIRRWRETAQARLSIGDEAGADRYLVMSAEARVKIHTLSASVVAIKSVLGNQEPATTNHRGGRVMPDRLDQIKSWANELRGKLPPMPGSDFDWLIAEVDRLRNESGPWCWRIEHDHDGALSVCLACLKLEVPAVGRYHADREDGPFSHSMCSCCFERLRMHLKAVREETVAAFYQEENEG